MHNLMKLDLETVEHVAMLARLGLSDEEKATVQDQLSSILDHISVLEEVDTDAIPPTAQVIELQNILREDVAGQPLSLEDVLKNAPRTENDFIKVNAVLDQS
jgi:aspartyl-tRNA(Asn)/glutamyl-tRNA(Gln) amidotransferase subunit C